MSQLPMIFQDRVSAGQALAERLHFLAKQNPIILALPRGGVPIGCEIAKQLKAPLDVLIVRKIGAPFNPEYGIGAITENGYFWINPDAAKALNLSTDEIHTLANQESLEVKRRIREYRGNRPLPPFHNRTVIVVDDGIATGVTARVACSYLQSQGAKNVILATPVCSASTVKEFRRLQVAKEVICLQEPELFYAVGQFYQNFAQISDEEVISLLSQAHSFANKPIRKGAF